MIEAHERVDLRDRLLELGAVLLHHAAGYDQSLDAVPLPPRYLEDGIDRLLLRCIDEAAGVDDHHVRCFEVVGDRDRRLLAELTEHDLGIDEIFGAAQGDHPDSFGHETRGEQRACGRYSARQMASVAPSRVTWA